MRRALLIGINDYEWAPLSGCVNDANNMEKVLSKHYDDTPNFHCKVLTSSAEKAITKATLMKNIKDLFSREADMALLYFSGHGLHNDLGGWLVTQDAVEYSEGITVNDIVTLANKANKVRQVFIVLDCCHSGNFGTAPILNDSITLLRKGISVLTASLHDQYAVEKKSTNQGLFTSILLEAFKGGAADTLGNVTAASIYDYTEKILGPWDQRPVFKANISEMTPLRYCKPKIEPSTIRELTNYFLEKDQVYDLDPSYDPELEPKNEKNEKIMAHFRKFLAEGLLTPVGDKHLYHAAKNSNGCKLTELGKFYWQIIKIGKI
ncbi:caspase family protein [uncultured Aquimarina sp.]|uniref:caspase family protein n=1 Tax=uncultured Aquimarina sp. TaxID=575652 RepID=UPI00262645E9|nr:caspase family protein [uncultured Aquimarina sp.]